MLIGPLLFLGSAPLAALACWTIARLVSGRRSRAARSTLGAPLDRVPEGGGVVTLRGRLAAETPLCRRFEDGRAAAVVTAAVQPPQGDSTGEASARAGGLVLQVGGTTVRLEGPVHVIAGSREAMDGSKAPLSGRVLERIGAADPEVAWMLSHRPAPVRLRSLASGDRVRVSGRLLRADAPGDGARGYRDAGVPWCLVPEVATEGASPAMRAAFEGAPSGPIVRLAAIAGAVWGPILTLAIGVLTLPPLPPPAPELPYLAPLEKPLPRDVQLDGVERALADGDFAAASLAMPKGHPQALYAAELHALAGRFEEGARVLDEVPPAKLSPEIRPCVMEAFHARGQKPRAIRALETLRELAAAPASVSTPRQRAVCALLLADLLPPGERMALLDGLPLRGKGPLTRLRALLTLEAGRLPIQTPEDGSDHPYVSALINRSPFAFDDGLLAVHLTKALEQVPNVHGDRRFRMREAERAAHLFSAVGDLSGALRAWDRANQDVGATGSEPLTALRVAIELRAGRLLEASRAVSNLPLNHDLLLLFTLMAGGAIDESLAGPGSEARAFIELNAQPDTPRRVDAMMTWGTSNDGERLFLIAPRIHAGREALLAWVRTGNPARVWHGFQTKGEISLFSPVQFLARLEERRGMAAALGDTMLTGDLERKLMKARTRLLRREIAGLVHVLDHAQSSD